MVVILFVFHVSLLVGFIFVWNYLYSCKSGVWWVPGPESILPRRDWGSQQGLVLNSGKTEGFKPIPNGSMMQRPAGGPSLLSAADGINSPE